MPTGTAAKAKSKWSLLERLDFLNTVAYERRTQSNIPTDESQEVSIEEVQTDDAVDRYDDETPVP